MVYTCACTQTAPHLVEEDVPLGVDGRGLSERGPLPDLAQMGEQVLLQLSPGHQGGEYLLHPGVVRVAALPAVLPDEALAVLSPRGWLIYRLCMCMCTNMRR